VASSSEYGETSVSFFRCTICSTRCPPSRTLKWRRNSATPHRLRCGGAVPGILERLGLGHRIDYKPRFLSGGERQRVAIGRALVNHPRLVLADEPTAALDKDSTVNVINLLKQTTIEHGSAVMMVTHDHRIIDCADRLVHMVDGRIMSDIVLHDALRICEFLRPIDLFKTLTPRQLTDVAEEMTKRHYAAGEIIIREGEPGEEFMLIPKARSR